MSSTVFVIWEESGMRQEVRGLCSICYPRTEDRVREMEDAMIVSPSGLAHLSSHGDVTDCGKDCTRLNWWHRC